MPVSDKGRVEHQKLNQEAALLSPGWVFGVQLDYSCRLKSVSSTAEKRVETRLSTHPSIHLSVNTSWLSPGTLDAGIIRLHIGKDYHILRKIEQISGKSRQNLNSLSIFFSFFFLFFLLFFSFSFFCFSFLSTKIFVFEVRHHIRAISINSHNF